jgi:hypothetical protein
MKKKGPPLPVAIFATTLPEDAAQTALTHAVAALKGIVTDLRAIYETLGEPYDGEAMSEGELPESPTFFMRSSIECVFDDYLDPLIATLGRAALITPAELERLWQERQR